MYNNVIGLGNRHSLYQPSPAGTSNDEDKLYLIKRNILFVGIKKSGKKWRA